MTDQQEIFQQLLDYIERTSDELSKIISNCKKIRHQLNRIENITRHTDDIPSLFGSREYDFEDIVDNICHEATIITGLTYSVRGEASSMGGKMIKLDAENKNNE